MVTKTFMIDKRATFSEQFLPDFAVPTVIRERNWERERERKKKEREQRLGKGGGWKRKHNMIQIEMSIQCLFETMVINSKREIDRERERER